MLLLFYDLFSPTALTKWAMMVQGVLGIHPT